MIGKESFRRKGFGREALTVAASLAKSKLGMNTLVAKIKQENAASIEFFGKRGFKNCGIVNGEVIFRKSL